MNAQDLMVGDLVRVSKDVCIEKGAIVRVHAIDGDNNFPEKGLKGCVTCVRINDPDRMSGGVWAEYLEPIPLTKEILEKNEFNKNDCEYIYRNSANDGYLYVQLYDNGCGVWDIKIKDYDKFNDIETVFKTNNIFLKVHELQHALRLCGIEKEIKL